jgi:hypothetical protein
VGAQVSRAQGQQQRCPARGVIGFDKGEGDRGPLQRGRRFACGQPCKCRAALRDIAAGGIIEWPGAVNLKFLSVSRQIYHRNFKFKTAPES